MVFKKTWSHDRLNDLFEKNGCVLLSDEYISRDYLYQFICKCGTKSEKSLRSFSSNPMCNLCVHENKRNAHKRYIREMNKDSKDVFKIYSRSDKERYVLVDADDFERLMQGKLWRIDGNGYGVRKNEDCSGLEWMHRLILKDVDAEIVDHINGDPSDNRKSNLRAATRAENNRNSKRHERNSHKYKGVTKAVTSDKFVASIVVNYKRKYLGVHETQEEAARAYNAAALELHGEFANLNVIMEEIK